MSLLVRKIQRSKWGECSENIEIPVNSDALTNCLKTTGNTLSVWLADDDQDLDYAKIALIGTMTKLEKIDIVILDSPELLTNNIVLDETPGVTMAKSLIGRHRDLAKLTVLEMTKVSAIIQRKLVNNEVFRLGKPELIRLFKKAFENELICKTDLSEELQKALA
jgi:hypothetical protein